MSAWLLLLGILGLLPGGPAEDRILWTRSWKEALKEAKTLNVPVYLAVLKDGCGASDGMVANTFQDRTLIAYLNEKAVPIVGHTADVAWCHEQEVTTDPKTGKTILRCPIYKGISCNDHNAIYAEAERLFEFKVTPRSYVLDAEGKPLDGSGKVRGNKPKDIMAALGKAQKKLGKPNSRSVYRGAQVKLAEGRASFEAKEFRKAIKKLGSLSGDSGAPGAMRKEAEKLLAKINEAGFEQLGKAKEVLENDREEGRKLLKKITEDFIGLEVAKAAKRALRESRKKPRKKGEEE
jgi:hypothetical protein